VFFNDPMPVENPVEQALRMACAMREAFDGVARGWLSRGHRLDLGIGVALGEATLGAIGFEGRWDYAAIGSVTNLAARLCSEAGGGQILADHATLCRIAGSAATQPLGDKVLKGFPRPVAVFNVVKFK
jgi:adenylate cyclase